MFLCLFLFFTPVQTILQHGQRIAEVVSSIDGLQNRLFDFVLEIKQQYQEKPKLKKLRRAFVENLGKQFPQRRVCDYWRSIRFAILNDVPKKKFKCTNWKRMQIEKDNNWASDVEDSDSIDSQDTVCSSTYDSVLGSPLRSANGFEVDISFPQDDMQNGWRDGSFELNISSSPDKVADGSAQRLELNKLPLRRSERDKNKTDSTLPGEKGMSV